MWDSLNNDAMKRLVIMLPLAVCISCTLSLRTDESEFCQSVFSIGGATKVTVASDAKERNVKYWTVMLFDADNPDAWYYASSGSSSDITCTVQKGRSYRAYAIANYPLEGAYMFSPSQITGETHLLQYASSLSSNMEDGLVMFGSRDLEELPSDTTPMPLKRLASKVTVSKITIDMDDPVYAAQEFVLNAVYLTNVYTSTSFGSDHSSPELDQQYWYNAMGWHGSGSLRTLDAITGDRGLGVTIPNGSSYDTVHTFYAYPNASTADSTGEDWSVRHTRLVIEGTLGNKKYYYTITLPAMKRNNSYTISDAKLRRPGSLDPEQTIPGILDATISISEDTWDREYYTSEAS